MNQTPWLARATFCTAGLALFACSTVQAQVAPTASISADTTVLSVAEAQRLAVTRNPQFLAETRERAMAEGRLRQARVLQFNPSLEFQAPGGGADGMLGEYEARIAQELEVGGQRGLRIKAARRDVERADFEVLDAARRTLANVTDAYIATYAAQRRARVAREILDLTRQLLIATRIQAREGEISALEANLAEIEFGRAQARVVAEEREATTARLELQRLIGLGPESTVRLADHVPARTTSALITVDSLVNVALQNRPDLAARARAQQQYAALTRLAGREAVPNVSLGALLEKNPGSGSGAESGNSPRVGVVVGVPIPIWNRNQGTVAERRTATEQAALSREATQLAVRTEVTEAYRSLQAAEEEARVFERDVVEPARANQRLLDAAFRAGKIGLPTLLLLRNQLLDAELGYWAAWLARQRAGIRLDAATSSILTNDVTSLLRGS